MPTYRFAHWEDGSTNPTRTITVTADITITATYEPVRNVTYRSEPVAVQGQVDATPLPSGSTIQVPGGTTITITVPAEVTV